MVKALYPLMLSDFAFDSENQKLQGVKRMDRHAKAHACFIWRDYDETDFENDTDCC